MRVLQEHAIQRVGATRPHKVDVCLIAATHKDLTALVQDGTLRNAIEHAFVTVQGESVTLLDVPKALYPLPVVGFASEVP